MPKGSSWKKKSLNWVQVKSHKMEFPQYPTVPRPPTPHTLTPHTPTHPHRPQSTPHLAGGALLVPYAKSWQNPHSKINPKPLLVYLFLLHNEKHIEKTIFFPPQNRGFSREFGFRCEQTRISLLYGKRNMLEKGPGNPLEEGTGEGSQMPLQNPKTGKVQREALPPESHISIVFGFTFLGNVHH